MNLVMIYLFLMIVIILCSSLKRYPGNPFKKLVWIMTAILFSWSLPGGIFVILFSQRGDISIALSCLGVTFGALGLGWSMLFWLRR